MKINQYLDSTYLKLAEQAQISEQETLKKVKELITETIDNNFRLVMIRPTYVALAKKMITNRTSGTMIGTVIGFHKGTSSINEKLQEAQKAIEDGADELDFVINYTAFLNGEIDLVKNEIIKGTKHSLDNGKTVKWIIEVAALNNQEIITICNLIRDTVLSNFEKSKAKNVFIKSSTGFYKTLENKPNGATFESIQLMLEHSAPLSVKAAGGVKSYNDAVKMINLGVLRIGTSSAKQIADGEQTKKSY